MTRTEHHDRVVREQAYDLGSKLIDARRTPRTAPELAWLDPHQRRPHGLHHALQLPQTHVIPAADGEQYGTRRCRRQFAFADRVAECGRYVGA